MDVGVGAVEILKRFADDYETFFLELEGAGDFLVAELEFTEADEVLHPLEA